MPQRIWDIHARAGLERQRQKHQQTQRQAQRAAASTNASAFIIEKISESERRLPISERFFTGGATTLRGFKFETAGPQGVLEPRSCAEQLAALRAREPKKMFTEIGRAHV